MRKIATTVAVIGVASGGWAGVATASAKPKHVKTPAYAKTLRVQIPEVMREQAIPGVVALVRSPSRGNWSATFGTADVDKQVPMSLSDSFRIGSNTKTVTSTVILQLAQEGKLKLDDPISKFIPNVPNGENITITQLSEMRSGLFSYTFDPGFNATLDNDPQKAWTPDELLAIAFSHPPDFAPGAQYEYSNTNIVLLGLVIEKLTGMSASQAFQKRIFGPLHLKHTFLPEATDSTIPAPHAQGYQFGTNVQTIDSYAVPAGELPAALNGTLKPLNFTDANPSWAWTAGGVISTPRELARYVKALVGGGLLNAKYQRIRLNSIKPISPGAPSGLGYGLGIVEFLPNVYGHDGQIPGYSTLMVYNRKTHDTVIIATNLAASATTGENAAVTVGKAVLATLYGAGSIPGGDPAGAPAASGPPAGGR